METILNGRTQRIKIATIKAGTIKPKKHAAHLRMVETWGTRYVVAACVLSSGLNAWANVDMCGSENVVAMGAAGILGAVVPGLAWMLSKIAGHAYRAQRRHMSMFVGAAAVALLVLSVWHCAHAIALLTGGGVVLSGLLAVGIDYGLVASEVSSVMACE